MKYHHIKTHPTTRLTSDFSMKKFKTCNRFFTNVFQTLPSPSIPQIITIYPKCCNLNLYFDKAHPSLPVKALK